MVFAFDGEDTVAVGGQHVHLVGNSMPLQNDPHLDVISFFGKKIGHELFEGVAGIAHLADGILQAVADAGPLGILAQKGKSLSVYLPGRNPFVSLQGHGTDNDLGHFVARPHILERSVYFHRVERGRFSRFFDHIQLVNVALWQHVVVFR